MAQPLFESDFVKNVYLGIEVSRTIFVVSSIVLYFFEIALDPLALMSGGLDEEPEDGTMNEAQIEDHLKMTDSNDFEFIQLICAFR